MTSWPFRKPSPLKLATEELEDALRQRLEACSAAEYAMAMVNYHSARIDRLRGAIRDFSSPSEEDGLDRHQVMD